MRVKTFDFVPVDLDGPVSFTATVTAESLPAAKNLVLNWLGFVEEPGGVPGVIELECNKTLMRLHFRLKPEAVGDDDNWEEVDDGGA